jgi:pyridoxamine 5'-phosphate oxidase
VQHPYLTPATYLMDIHVRPVFVRTSAQMADPDPIALYQRAAEQARQHGIDTAPVALATADARARPSVRIVLIRHVDDRGFVFHTNYTSRKAAELVENAQAALCFHWPTLEQQIRVEGSTQRLSDSESDAYFAGRPRGSQIGAWASDQSAELPSPDTLEERTREIERRFAGQAVPRPPHWGGIRITPERMEFWYGRESRLHERFLYVRASGQWQVKRLYP